MMLCFLEIKRGNHFSKNLYMVSLVENSLFLIGLGILSFRRKAREGRSVLQRMN